MRTWEMTPKLKSSERRTSRLEASLPRSVSWGLVVSSDSAEMAVETVSAEDR